jgi:hypothetical protein
VSTASEATPTVTRTITPTSTMLAGK